MKLLIIDDDPDFRALIKVRLKEWMSECVCEEYDPCASGRPGADFDWSAYDCVMLDHELGGGETGLDWLQQGVIPASGPPVVYITGAGDEYVAVRAVKLGAGDYLKKIDFSGPRLARMVRAATGQNEAEHEMRRRVDGQSADAAATVTPDGDPLSERKFPPDVPGYKIFSLVGQGASSSVFLGERTEDHHTVVLKIMQPQAGLGGDAAVRFAREATLLTAIRSEHVVRVYDHGFVNHLGYMVMEFLPRGDLKQRIAQGLASRDVVNCIENIAMGLKAIHERGIVHRDLKPANVMFRWDDSLVLADFGLSRNTEEESALTSHGRVLGTPYYLSPEQALGQPAGLQSDLYSAGAIFFEMLTGRRPYRADNVTSLMYQHVHAETPKLPDVHRRYQPLIDRLMAKKREERFESAEAFLEALEAVRRR